MDVCKKRKDTESHLRTTVPLFVFLFFTSTFSALRTSAHRSPVWHSVQAMVIAVSSFLSPPLQSKPNQYAPTFVPTSEEVVFPRTTHPLRFPRFRHINLARLFVRSVSIAGSATFCVWQAAGHLKQCTRSTIAPCLFHTAHPSIHLALPNLSPRSHVVL